METVGSDYFVVKPANLHLTREDALRVGFSEEEIDAAWGEAEDEETGETVAVSDGELRVEPGALIPGEIAEGWGEGGRVVHHLVHNRILAPVPQGSGAPAEPSATIDNVLLESRLGELEERLSDTEARAEAAESERDAALEQLEAAGGAPAVEDEAADDDEQPESELSEEEQAKLAALLEGGGISEEAALATVLAERPAPDAVEEAKVSFPQHKGGGVFVLSDGSEVKGKQAAIAAQVELDAKPPEA